MRNISAWAIRHPVTPIVLFVVLFFLGSVSFWRLLINLQPDVSFPVVDLNISQPGAAPGEMETQIAQKVEGSIASIGNIHHMQTFITEGLVHVMIELNIGTPIDRAVTDVRDAVDAIRDGAVDYLAKPIDLDQLLTAVRQATGLARNTPLKFNEDRQLPPNVVARAPC